MSVAIQQSRPVVTINQDNGIVVVTAKGGLPGPSGTPGADGQPADLALAGVLRPSGFPDLSLPFGIYRNGRKFHIGGWDLASLKPSGGVTYYVSITGNDANDGLTADTPLQKIVTALNKADAGLVIVAPGVYGHSYGWEGAAVGKDIAVVASGPGVIVSKSYVGSWTVHSGNCYKATRSNCYAVADATSVDSKGDYEFLALAADLAACIATAGTWWTDNVTVYVHTSDNRIPDSSIRAYLNSANGAFSGASSAGKTIYVEGIEFHGGTNAFFGSITSLTQQTRAYLKNCVGKYAIGNGLSLQGYIYGMLQGCTGAKNQADGLNYHGYSTADITVVEIDSTGRDNGFLAATDINNGSTGHDGGVFLRINPTCIGNRGPNIVDTGVSTSWTLGAIATGSVAATAGQNCDIQTDGTMWVDTADTGGSPYGVRCDAGGVLYLSDVLETAPRYGAGSFIVNQDNAIVKHQGNNSHAQIDAFIAAEQAENKNHLFAGQHADATVPSTVTETTLYSVTIPGGSMGPNGILRITTLWAVTNSANSKTLRIYFGGTAFMVVTQTTTQYTQIQTIIRNRNSESVQLAFVPGSNNSYQSYTGTAPASGAVNTSVDQLLTITGTLANTGEVLTLKDVFVEVLK